MTAFDLYVLTRVGALHTLMLTLAIIGIISTGVLLVTAYCLWINEVDEEELLKVTKFAKISGITTLISCCLLTLIPDTKTLALIYVVPKIANSSFTKELSTVPEDLVKVAKKKLSELLEEEKKEKP